MIQFQGSDLLVHDILPSLRSNSLVKNSGSDSILVARTNDSGASTSHPLATFVLFSDEEHIILVEIKFVLNVCVHEIHVILVEIKLVWNV